MGSDSTELMLRPGWLMRLWSVAMVVICTVIVLLSLSGVLPIDTVLTRLMLTAGLIGWPFLIRDVWWFNVRPAVEVKGSYIALYSRGLTSRFTTSNVTSIALQRVHLNDYLTLELDSGLVHRIPVQIDDRDHRAQVESWVAQIARVTETEHGP